MELSPVMQRYVLHWGEMGARWGVSRSVSQIHALLYLSSQALTAEEIADTLSIARSNVSTSLKELQSWRLVHIAHVMGDRRDYFESRKDLWEMVTTIIEERKKREIDPTLTVLRQCVVEASDDRKTPPDVKARIEGMLEFLELVSNWHNELKQMPRPVVLKLMKLGAKIAKFIGGS
jgi:DNA-binding transcriptional regulator GbsR (MarR family)